MSWGGWRAGWPRRKADCEGRYAVTRVELKSCVQSVPAGTTVRLLVAGGSGFTIKTVPCCHCGVSVSMRKVGAGALRLLPPGDPSRAFEIEVEEVGS